MAHPTVQSVGAVGIKLNWEWCALEWAQYYGRDITPCFDLARYDVIGPDGLSWLLSLTEWRARKRRTPVVVVLPRRQGTLAWLRELRFVEHFLSAGGVFNNEEVLWSSSLEDSSKRKRFPPSRATSPTFIQRIDSDSWYGIISASYTYFENDVSAMLGSTGWDDIREESRPFQQAIQEVIHNVAIHTRTDYSDGIGFTCYRPWPRHPVLRFACSDIGPGVRTTLSRKGVGYRIADDSTAVMAALMYRHEQPEDGVVGLFNALGFIRRFSGRLKMRTGDALLTLDLQAPRQQKLFDQWYARPTLDLLRGLVTVSVEALIPGTHVAIDLIRPTLAHPAKRVLR